MKKKRERKGIIGRKTIKEPRTASLTVCFFLLRVDGALYVLFFLQGTASPTSTNDL